MGSAKKAIRWLDEHFEEALLVLMLVLIACVELIQVIIRNVPFIPALTWAEEFCRFCWIWSVFLSLPYTIKKCSMLQVTVLIDRFPPKVHKVFLIAIDLINFAVMLTLGIVSIAVMKSVFGSGEQSPAMLWPMWVVYGVMPVGFFLAAFRALQQACGRIRYFKDGNVLSSREMAEAEAAAEVRAGRAAERIGEAEPAGDSAAGEPASGEASAAGEPASGEPASVHEGGVA